MALAHDGELLHPTKAGRLCAANVTIVVHVLSHNGVPRLRDVHLVGISPIFASGPTTLRRWMWWLWSIARRRHSFVLLS